MAHINHLLKSASQAIVSGAASAKGLKIHSNPKLEESILGLLKTISGPVIAVGESQYANLDECTNISATIEGNYEHASVAEIGLIAEDALNIAESKSAEKYLAEIDTLRHEKRLGAGLNEITQLIDEGRVRTLYIEHNLLRNPISEPAHKLTEIDKLVTQTLRHKGQIAFLPDDSLSSYEGAVAGLRY